MSVEFSGVRRRSQSFWVTFAFLSKIYQAQISKGKMDFGTVKPDALNLTRNVEAEASDA